MPLSESFWRAALFLGADGGLPRELSVKRTTDDNVVVTNFYKFKTSGWAPNGGRELDLKINVPHLRRLAWCDEKTRTLWALI
jgi:hypothetical protein